MESRTGTLGGADVACLTSSGGVEAAVGWGALGVTDFGPPAKYRAAAPAMTISGTIAMIDMSRLRWAALTGFTKAGLTGCAWAGLPTSTEYTRTGSAMFLSWVAPRLLTTRSSRDFTCRPLLTQRWEEPHGVGHTVDASWHPDHCPNDGGGLTSAGGRFKISLGRACLVG